MQFAHSKTLFLKSMILLLLCLSSIRTQALQAVVTTNIFYAPTKQNTFSPYVEIYWQIDPQSILFRKENNAWRAGIRTDITIREGEKSIKEEHYILTTPPVTEGKALYTQNIIDLRRYELKPGTYAVDIHFTDELKKESEYRFTDSIIVNGIGLHPALSDIQLVDTSIISDKEDVFQRNGTLQLPLCSNFLDERRKTLRYYAELYQPQPNDNNQLIVKTFISKKEMDYAVNHLIRTDTPEYTTVALLKNEFSLKTLPSGNYYLNILVENMQHEKITSKSLFFQVLNAHPEQPEMVKSDTTGKIGDAPKDSYINLNSTFLGKYKPEQIRAILKMLVPVADPTEKTNINGFLKRPDDIYSRYFIYNFWLKRNKLRPDAAWKAYADMVKEVNKLFGSSLLTGYESERGIVYLKYGPPTERVIVNNESNALPYEVWQYNSLPNATNAVFLFYKPGLITNDYRLLHSTVTGELKNRNWRTSLFVGGAAADAAASRAEQYLGNR